jgi:hypothetical protein
MATALMRRNASGLKAEAGDDGEFTIEDSLIWAAEARLYQANVTK